MISSKNKNIVIVIQLIKLLLIGFIACLLYFFLPYDEDINKGLSLLFFIAILWVTEVVNITITALMIPILAVLVKIPHYDPVVGDVVPITAKESFSLFAHPIIFLFLGGFALSAVLKVQKLDKKIINFLISISKNNLFFIALTIFIVTVFFSMWISNTATAAMMIPLALSMIEQIDHEGERKKIALFLILGIAYSATIGGLGTLVGSPPNAIASAELGYDFSDWLKVGFPIILILFPAMIFVLYLFLKPNLKQSITIPLEEIDWTLPRVLTIIVFLLTVLAWLCGSSIEKYLSITNFDSLVAVTAVIVISVLGLASWKSISKNTNWGILLLFGGGLTLSAVLTHSGATTILGRLVSYYIGGFPQWVIIMILVMFIMLLSEFTSNTATAALLVPVFSSIAPHLGLPNEVLVLIVGIGASCVFMLPVATPPNALAYGTGLIQQKEMVNIGKYVSLSCMIILTLYSYYYIM